jgi:signal transduction histidine kinase
VIELAKEEGAAPALTASGEELLVRLRWLLRLRWLVVPAFLAAVVASDLLSGSGRPWSILAVGAALLAANGAYGWILSRPRSPAALLTWARVEAALVVLVPVALMLWERDTSTALRYGVLVGVVGAAVALPRTGEVAVVAVFAAASLVVADALVLGLAGGRVADGHLARWVIEAGVIFSVATLVSFLHQERARAAARLRSQVDGIDSARREWEATFDNMAELVVICDREGTVTRVNRSFAKALGARPLELAGRPLEAVLAGHPDRWWTASADGIVEIEDPAFDSLFEVSVTRLPDRVVRVARDIGEARRLYSRLVQADKLAAVGVLATGVAHEINNPTAFITSNLTELRRYLSAYESAFSELAAIGLEAGSADRVSALLQRAEVAFARREAVAAISESLQGMERIRQVVASLRSVARRDPMGEPMQPVALAEVIESVVRTAAHDLKSASARVEVKEPCQVIGHRGELVDVVLNLVANAVQARDGERPNQVAVELRREGAMAVVRVADTGRGISASHMKRLFEPFFTTKGPGEGTGLGLSLARNIVLAHGGSIDVQTEVGSGTTFTVRLPLAETEGSAPALRSVGRSQGGR